MHSLLIRIYYSVKELTFTHLNLSHAIRLNSLQIVDKKKRKRRQNRLRKFNFLRSILRAIIFHLVPYFLKTIRSILSFAEKHKCIIPIYRELSNYNKKITTA